LLSPLAADELSDFFDAEAPAAAGELSDFFSALAPPEALLDASLLGFCSWVVDALPLAAPPVLLLPVVADGVLGVLALPEAEPDALPCASVLGFCSWLIDGLCPLCDCCLSLSWATALSDRNAAATATAMGLNLMKSP
jgi:hypothetical protein